MEKQQMINNGSQVNSQSQFYVPVEAEASAQQLQAHVLDLQSRTRQAVQRLTRASNHLEQQNLPQQGPIIIELREIASLLSDGIAEEAEMAIDDPPSAKLQSRSNSLSVKMHPRSNSTSVVDENVQRKLNGQMAHEMVYFGTKKKF